jgi:hypothetical protein
MRLLFSALDPRSMDKDDWKQPLQHNKIWDSLESQISQHCSTLVWKPGFHLCVDDDKVTFDCLFYCCNIQILNILQLRNCSNLVSVDFCFSRNKTPKTFGPVFNLTVLLGTGLFVSGTMSYQGDIVSEVNKRMFRQLCQTDVDAKIELRGSTVASERAYNANLYQLLIEGFGGLTLNTVKRGPSLPLFLVKSDSESLQQYV